MKKSIRIVVTFIACLVIIGLTGCASKMTKSAEEVKSLQDQLKAKDQTISTLSGDLKSTEDELNNYRTKLTAAEKSGEQKQFELDEQKMAMEQAKLLNTAPLLPPNPKVGECYARVYMPPKYKTTKKTILKNQPSERVQILAGEYGYEEKEVLVKEASERIEVVPAQYGWETETVLVKEASYKMVDVPAEYEWTTEKILVKPAHTVWKRGQGLVEKVDNTTGEIMCLVAVPATYKTVKKKIVKSEATSRKIEIPAQYKTIKRKVLIAPASVKKISIPAEYKTVKVKKMITPPKEKRIVIPAEYETITLTERVSDGKLVWRRVLCETNMGKDIILRLQRALKENGHDPVFIDGVIGWRTIKALKAYQTEKGLAVGKITYKTLESLGIVHLP